MKTITRYARAVTIGVGLGTFAMLSLFLSAPAIEAQASRLTRLDSSHNEDAVAVSGDTGQLCLGVRNDAGTALGADGDYLGLQINSSGALVTTCTLSAGTEDAAETPGGSLAMIGAVVRAGKTGSSATAADNATVNVTTTGGLWGASDQVEDDAETAGGPLAMVGTVQRTLLVPSAGTTGDNATLNTSSLGALWTEEATRAVAYGSSPTAVAAGVFGAPIADLEGRPYVNNGHPRAVNCHVSTTGTTATQITGCEVVASNSYYITSIYVSGDIANATATPWKITSGTSTDCTGATVIASGYHPALSGQNITFPTPIKVTASHGLCILDGVTGTKTAVISGYIAP